MGPISMSNEKIACACHDSSAYPTAIRAYIHAYMYIYIDNCLTLCVQKQKPGGVEERDGT